MCNVWVLNVFSKNLFFCLAKWVESILAQNERFARALRHASQTKSLLFRKKGQYVI